MANESVSQIGDNGEYILVTQEELKDILEKHYARRESVILKGPPGCGKTAMPIQIAEEHDLPMLSPFNCSLSDGTDFKGMPVFGEDKTSQIWVKDVRWIMASEAPTLVLIDEVGQGSAGSIAASVSIFREKRIDDLYLHPDTWVVGTTNRAQDKCGSAALPKQLLDGVYKYEVGYSADALVRYELEKNLADVDMLTLRFLRMKGDAALAYDPAKEVNSTMRGWSAVMRLLKVDATTHFATLAGRIGRGLATELMAFRNLAPMLPSVEEVLLNPTKASVPENPSALFLISDMMADKATANNFDALVEYAKRIPPEFQAAFVKSSLQRKPEVASTSSFTQWGVGFAAVLS